MHIIKTVTVEIDGLHRGWIDTGIVLAVGQGIHIQSSGIIGVTNGAGNGDPLPAEGGRTFWTCFPEGTYYSQFDPEMPTTPYQPHVEDIPSTLTFEESGFSGFNLPYCPTGANLALIGVIVPDGDVPGQDQPDTFRPNRDYISEDVPAGRLWLTFNDLNIFYDDNYGSFTCVVSQLANLNAGAASPFRYVPPSWQVLLNSTEQTRAWVLGIQLEDAWEYYTSWDLPLDLPGYEDVLGNVTPAGEARPCFASLSRLPAELKLGSQSADASVHAPRRDAILDAGQSVLVYLDRDKLLKGRYLDKHYELFEVDPTSDMTERMLWVVGRIGNLQLDDLKVTGELLSYDEIANRNTGDVLHVICQVGARYGEDFGLQRCRCEIATDDGPVVLGLRREDWTVLATVTAATNTQVNLTYDNTFAISGEPLDEKFPTLLAHGALEFTVKDGDDPVSGNNQWFKVPISWGRLVSTVETTATVQIATKIEFPYVPQAGDKVYLVSGCDRSKKMCIMYGNLQNMRAQDLPGNSDLLNRTRVS